ncbi:MAG: retropepsin-like aspartic protease [Candidatus Baltobacteraceae bacterium]
MRIRLCLAAFCAGILSLFTAVPAFADEASDLLAKHQAFTGWQFGEPSMLSMETLSTTTDKGSKPVRIEHGLRVGLIYRIDAHDVKASTDSSSGFTGNVFWYSDENGFTVPVQAEAAKRELARNLFFSDAVQNLPWRISGKKHIWDKDYAIVTVEHETAGKIDFYVDPQTGAYGGVVIDPKGDYEETIRVLSYRDAGKGRQVVASWKLTDSENTTTIDAVTPGTQISNASLHPPGHAAQWSFDSPAAFPVTLLNHRIIIKARVNGVEGRFLLDSGADNIYLAGTFARRAGLTAIGHEKSYTLYGSIQNDKGIAKTIEIGGNQLNNAYVTFGQDAIEDDAPDGLMGFDLLAGTFATVNFEKSTMQIQDPAVVDPATIAGVRIPIDLSSGLPKAQMQVQDKTVTVNALFDTGSPRSVLIAENLPQKYHLNFASSNGLTGCGPLDNMKIGPIVYEHPTACTWGMEGRTALVGYDFLSGLSKVIFDYSRGGMILVPKAK